jgi:hypothetical protein
MRINRFFVGMLVLGLAVGAIGAVALAVPGNGHGHNASDEAIDTVSWSIRSFIELTIEDDSFDFGEIDAGVDSVSVEDANTLRVFSNIEWELTYAVSGQGSNHLSIALSSNDGNGNGNVTVGYSLNDLRSMDPGDYTATVIYTATAK